MKKLYEHTYNLIDSILAIILFVITSPFFVLAAILVKLDSPGPLFYVQQRYTKDKRVFNLYKFRSMNTNAEKNKPVWSKENDIRTSKIGKFLRVSHIDELPQLLNILKGDMSLVGPRPERPYFADKFAKVIPNYEERHTVNAGLTGWAQVNGWRGNSSVIERTKCDLYYIRNRSILFNLKIMLMTPFEKPIAHTKEESSYDLTFSHSEDVLAEKKPLRVPIMNA